MNDIHTYINKIYINIDGEHLVCIDVHKATSFYQDTLLLAGFFCLNKTKAVTK